MSGRPPVKPTTTEAYGLPPEAAHLIQKLRNMPPEQRNTIIHPNKDTK